MSHINVIGVVIRVLDVSVLLGTSFFVKDIGATFSIKQVILPFISTPMLILKVQRAQPGNVRRLKSTKFISVKAEQYLKKEIVHVTRILILNLLSRTFC